MLLGSFDHLDGGFDDGPNIRIRTNRTDEAADIATERFRTTDRREIKMFHILDDALRGLMLVFTLSPTSKP